MSTQEPNLLFCTQRDSLDKNGVETIDLECRFEDGQKFAAVQIDGDFPELAHAVAGFLNKDAVAPDFYKALQMAEDFIANGVALGFIRMPDPDVPDPAHLVLPAVRAALAAAERGRR